MLVCFFILGVPQNLILDSQILIIILKINFGESVGIKYTSAQIKNYSASELLNRQVVAVCNFNKKNIEFIIWNMKFFFII